MRINLQDCMAWFEISSPQSLDGEPPRALVLLLLSSITFLLRYSVSDPCLPLISGPFLFFTSLAPIRPIPHPAVSFQWSPVLEACSLLILRARGLPRCPASLASCSSSDWALIRLGKRFLGSQPVLQWDACVCLWSPWALGAFLS